MSIIEGLLNWESNFLRQVADKFPLIKKEFCQVKHNASAGDYLEILLTNQQFLRIHLERSQGWVMTYGKLNKDGTISKAFKGKSSVLAEVGRGYSDPNFVVDMLVNEFERLLAFSDLKNVYNPESLLRLEKLILEYRNKREPELEAKKTYDHEKSEKFKSQQSFEKRFFGFMLICIALIPILILLRIL